MRAFEYASPKGLQQALGLLGTSWGDTEVLAGGTDLLALMKDDVLTPKRLVNIKDLPGMHAISRDPKGGARIGALVTLVRVAEAPEIKADFPALAHACDEAASPQIRNMATLGGNLCQRPRCWYFRNGMGLLAQHDGKSLVTEGENRYHAILGNDGPAYFVSPSTVAPALIAYNARLRIAGPNGTREVAAEKFYRIPQSEQEREHDLQPNEIITEIVLPAAVGVKAATYEVRQKETFDWPYAMAAVALTMNGNTVKSARIVMGAVAPVPWVSEEAAAAITGKPVNEKTAAAAGAASVSKARALSQNGYKIKLAGVAVKRALLAAASAHAEAAPAAAAPAKKQGGAA